MNYGDSLIEEVSIKLKSPNTTGILIEHQGDPQGTSYYVVNNVLLNRVQVNSAGVAGGYRRIWLRRVVRAALVNIDVEFLDTAYKVEGVAASGNVGQHPARLSTPAGHPARAMTHQLSRLGRPAQEALRRRALFLIQRQA